MLKSMLVPILLLMLLSPATPVYAAGEVTVLVAGALIDTLEGKTVANPVVEISGDRNVAVTAGGTIPDGATVIDFGDATILPGLAESPTTADDPILTAIHKPFMPLIDVPAASVDIVLDDDAFPLRDYGIPGHVFHTPGHSPGSVSVLLESGEAFVGDLAMNRLPLCFSPGLPIFADDPSAVIRSWEILLELGATMIYPAHGKPFPASIIRKAVSWYL